jgi:hypothetical protein
LISNPDVVYPLFGELAHANQRRDNPKEYKEKSVSEYKETLERAKTLGISEDSAQKYEYSTPGTVEHEAHKIIEPRLKQQFIILVKEFGKQKTQTHPPSPTKN